MHTEISVTGDGSQSDAERQPLLARAKDDPALFRQADEQSAITVKFEDGDPGNPRNWSRASKYLQILQVFILALICPMASSIFVPATELLAESFDTTPQLVQLGQAGFVCMLGIGPLFLAPMSETFGRRPLYLCCVAAFTLLQVPTALNSNLPAWVVLRTLTGFCASVGVANGGGTVSDLFETRSRAKVLGVYLAAPLLGPSIGPFIGGMLVGTIGNWRWIFWLLTILAGLATLMCYFFLGETQGMKILQQRKRKLEKENPGTTYEIEGDSGSQLSVLGKIRSNSTRAIRILTTQPIVMTMSLYQALVFCTMYTLYSQYSRIWPMSPYNFTDVQLALTYLSPALGFAFTAIFIVLFIDRLYDYLATKNKDDGRPEYRLPMANIGAVFLPASLFWFGWTVEKEYAWPVPVAATLFFGASQVSIFNTVQTYYIDAFEKQAASALAAGSFLRSVIGGIVPLFVSPMFDKLGYGLGMSIFGILALVLMPAPTLFYWYGRQLRERFPFKE